MPQNRIVPTWDGARITYLRKLFGSISNPLSLNDFAALLQARGVVVSHKSLGRYEKGQVAPQVDVAIAIARALGVSESWFVLGMDEGRPPDVQRLPPVACEPRRKR